MPNVTDSELVRFGIARSLELSTGLSEENAYVARPQETQLCGVDITSSVTNRVRNLLNVEDVGHDVLHASAGTERNIEKFMPTDYSRRLAGGQVTTLSFSYIGVALGNVFLSAQLRLH